MFDFRLPDLGKGLTEAAIIQWHVKNGQSVDENDLLVEVETDKATVAIPSPTHGTVVSTHGTTGQSVRVGDVLVTIDDGNKVEITTNVSTCESTGHAISAASRAEVCRERATHPAHARVLAAPATRFLARQLGVELHLVHPSGPDGIVTKEDVRRYAERHA
ncbi:MAG: E3 binding domain-containing protein [Myxococcales bacterium]|nr:E3 binding domain-containing protein [Myxococcales bacterium]